MSRFPTTQWTLVVAADTRRTPEGREALAALCSTYWQPLYAYVRKRGYDADSAQDLVQGFFARFLGKDYLEVVGRDKGRFRSYLLAALNHYVSDEMDRARALKRGGGATQIPIEIDFEDGERQYLALPAQEPDPEKVFERRWALALLDRVLDRLKARYADSRRLDRYEGLIPFVTGDDVGVSYRRAGERLGMSEGAVKVAVHRLRGHYFESLKEEVANTVADEADVESELRHLLQALGS